MAQIEFGDARIGPDGFVGACAYLAVVIVTRRDSSHGRGELDGTVWRVEIISAELRALPIADGVKEVRRGVLGMPVEALSRVAAAKAPASLPPPCPQSSSMHDHPVAVDETGTEALSSFVVPHHRRNHDQRIGRADRAEEA